MRDKIKNVLDDFYNVNMFNEHVRQTIATEIEKALTGSSTVDQITVPIESKVETEPILTKKVKEKKSLPTKSRKNVQRKSLKNLENRSSVLNEKKERNKKNKTRSRRTKKSQKKT